MNKKELTIAFHGAAGVVTGSKHLITTPSGTKILLDCGLFQGKIDGRHDMNRNFGFNPAEVDYVLLSHAHIDHSGLLPRLVREGFNGVIFATPATIQLCELMLYDSAHIQRDDLRYLNERRKRKGESQLEPLYDLDDVQKTLNLFEPLNYGEELKLNKEVCIHFTDAGHLLGSAAVHIDIQLTARTKRSITFTGDIGRLHDSILRSPEPFRQPDILICESTYGSRLHPETSSVEQELLRVVKETCVEKLGKLIIPAFSLDRTQEIIYALEKMHNNGQLPNIKIFVDSPLSVRATRVMQDCEDCFNDDFIKYMHLHDPDPFVFKNLKYVTDVQDSMAINDLREPCIIISASGMAEAGRVKHHIKNNIGNHQSTIMFVGYCTPESLGGRLKSGVKEVRIFGDVFPVKANIESLEYYSSHADYAEIITYLKCIDASKVKDVFLVHGETTELVAMKARLKAEGFTHIHIPNHGEDFDVR
jgi:metallo-beta-lactamase family protein